MSEFSGVDIVVPFKHSAHFLKTTLSSVMAQGFSDFNLYVVDDASSQADHESLIEALSGFSDARLHHVRLSHGVGPSGARNAGIRLGRAPFVAFLDADDLWHRDKLARQVRLLSSSPRSTCAVYSGYNHIDALGGFAGDGLVPPRLRGSVHQELLFGGNLISGSCSSVLVRREALEDVGLFDETLKFAEDWDLWLRLACTGEFEFLPDPLVSIRLHEQSLQFNVKSSRAEMELLSIMRVVEKHAGADSGALFRHYAKMARRFVRRELTFNQLSELRALLRESGPFCAKIADHLSLLRLVRALPKIGMRSLLG